MNYELIFSGGIVLSLLSTGGCGGQIDDPNSRNNSVGGAGAVNNGGASASGGGTSPSGGLVEITPTQLGKIEQICLPAPAFSSSGADAAVHCSSAFPQIPTCGSIGHIDAQIDNISVVYVGGDGADFLVGYTSPDCASGDGYYADTVLDELVLCPTTCIKVIADSGGSVMAYPTYCVAPPCIS